MSSARDNKPILIFVTSGYPFKVIAEPYILDEMSHLSKEFKKIFVIPMSGSKSDEVWTLPENAELVNINPENIGGVRNFPALKIVLSELKSFLKLPQTFDQLRYYMAYLKSKFSFAEQIIKTVKVKDLVQNNKVVVYSYWLSEPALIAAFIKKKFPEVKTVSRAHGYDVFEDQSKYGFIPFKEFKLKYLDKIFSVSKKGQKHLQNQFGYNSDKFKRYFLGSRDNGFTGFSPEKEFSIATCSVIRAIKRLELMPDILKHVNFQMTWHVLGDGPDLTLLKKKLEGVPAHIKVKFYGALTKNEVEDFYKSNQVNLFVSLSSSEGLPVSMMEAISFGIPLLSTDAGGCNEICNEKTGILIPKDFDPKEVAEQIFAFKNSDKNSDEFRKGARKFWEENFNAEVNYRNFAKEISEL